MNVAVICEVLAHAVWGVSDPGAHHALVVPRRLLLLPGRYSRSSNKPCCVVGRVVHGVEDIGTLGEAVEGEEVEARRESVAIASWWTPMKMGARTSCLRHFSPVPAPAWGLRTPPNRRHAASCALVNKTVNCREGGDQAVSTRHD